MVIWWAPQIQMLLSYPRHVTVESAFHFLKQIITEPRPITHMEAVSIAMAWKVQVSLFHCNGLQ